MILPYFPLNSEMFAYSLGDRNGQTGIRQLWQSRLSLQPARVAAGLDLKELICTKWKIMNVCLHRLGAS
jgi:hypothetical protein